MIVKECKFETILIDSRCLRKGILLFLSSHDGKQSCAEISPLPGFSQETLEEALSQLKNLKRRLLSTWWTKGSLHLLSTLGLYPSVYFGVESALSDLLFPLESPPSPCQKYALLFGSHEEILSRAREIHAEGYQHAKIKLGHFDPATAHHLIRQLDDQFLLRIDLNRKWDYATTMEFCSYYPKDYFTYIEEPCSRYKDLLRFPYPFAIDETLREIKNIKPYLEAKSLKALILKPTLTYPLNEYLRLSPEIIITSSFESPVGISQIERLIRRLELHKNPHGLDTLRYFENDNSLSYCPLEKTMP